MQNEYLRTTAFCLQKTNRGKQSARLDLFSRDAGKISLYQKGFFQPKSLYPAQFDLGHELDLLLIRQGQSWRIQEVSVNKIHPLENYEALTLVSFVMELLLKMETDYSDHAPVLFSMLETLLMGVSTGQIPFNSLLYFQCHLLLKAGLASMDFLCEYCGNGISGDTPAFALPQEWSFSCPACMKKRNFKTPLVLQPSHRQILESWKDETCLEKGLSRFFSRSEVSGFQVFLNEIYRKDFPLKSLRPFMELLERKSGKKS